MNQAALAAQRLLRPRSPIGVMVDSIDRPHGDHVDRTAAATATTDASRISNDVMNAS